MRRRASAPERLLRSARDAILQAPSVIGDPVGVAWSGSQGRRIRTIGFDGQR
jgi:hypothetical protein